MTTITLPPDLETRLADEARRCGASVEEVAVDGLRRIFPNKRASEPSKKGGSLYDFLQGYMGTLSGPTELSQETGKKFGDLLEEDYRQQQERRHSKEKS